MNVWARILGRDSGPDVNKRGAVMDVMAQLELYKENHKFLNFETGGDEYAIERSISDSWQKDQG